MPVIPAPGIHRRLHSPSCISSTTVSAQAMSLGFLLSAQWWLIWGIHQGPRSVPRTPGYLSSSPLALRLLLFRAMHAAHCTRKPQLCKPASSCPSLPPSTLHITSSFDSLSLCVIPGAGELGWRAFWICPLYQASLLWSASQTHSREILHLEFSS